MTTDEMIGLFNPGHLKAYKDGEMTLLEALQAQLRTVETSIQGWAYMKEREIPYPEEKLAQIELKKSKIKAAIAELS